MKYKFKYFNGYKWLDVLALNKSFDKESYFSRIVVDEDKDLIEIFNVPHDNVILGAEVE